MEQAACCGGGGQGGGSLRRQGDIESVSHADRERLNGCHLPRESRVSLNNRSEMAGLLASLGVASSSFPKAGVQSSPSIEHGRKRHSDKHWAGSS